MRSLLFRFTIGSLFLLILLARADAKTRRPPPDAGVSDEELSAMGANAVPFLIGRLENLEHEKYFKGTVHRLSVAGLEAGGHPRIQEAFESFVERNSKRDDVPFSTVSAMYHALRAMAYVGGERGIEYLLDWVKQGHKRVRCGYEGHANAASNASTLRDAAVLALGVSGNLKARKYLEQQAKEKPDVPYKGSFQGAVKQALKYSSEVEIKGVKEFVLPTLKGPKRKPSKER